MDGRMDVHTDEWMGAQTVGYVDGYVQMNR